MIVSARAFHRAARSRIRRRGDGVSVQREVRRICTVRFGGEVVGCVGADRRAVLRPAGEGVAGVRGCLQRHGCTVTVAARTFHRAALGRIRRRADGVGVQGEVCRICAVALGGKGITCILADLNTVLRPAGKGIAGVRGGLQHHGSAVAVAARAGNRAARGGIRRGGDGVRCRLVGRSYRGALAAHGQGGGGSICIRQRGVAAGDHPLVEGLARRRSIRRDGHRFAGGIVAGAGAVDHIQGLTHEHLAVAVLIDALGIALIGGEVAERISGHRAAVGIAEEQTGFGRGRRSILGVINTRLSGKGLVRQQHVLLRGIGGQEHIGCAGAIGVAGDSGAANQLHILAELGAAGIHRTGGMVIFHRAVHDNNLSMGVFQIQTGHV